MSAVKKIPVSQPLLGEKESQYLNDALGKGAISGFFGEYIERFEQGFANFCGSEHGVAVSNGTTALHLALVALDIKTGDEVLTSTLTNMATFFAILYQGATPVPIDIEPDTWNMDPRLLEQKITPKTKAIMVVHLFGHPVEMGPVMEIAKRHNLRVIEDCAESHGAEYLGRKAGSIGDIGCFSFYANKIITTGEGGMCTTNDSELAARMKTLRSLAFGAKNKFMHCAVGFNYRLTNLQAALGCAQLEKLDWILKRKRAIATLYTEQLKGEDLLQLPIEKGYAKNVYWMYHLELRGAAATSRSEVMKQLSERGIETREGFVPYNMQDIFIAEGLTRLEECPLANKAALRTFYLPTGVGLTDEEVSHVATNLKEVLRQVVRT